MIRGVAAAIITAILVIPLASIPYATTRSSLGVYNEGPGGVGHLVEDRGIALVFAGRPAALLHGGLDRLDPAGHALLVLGGDRAYGEAEAEVLRRFLADGGRALIADDRGSARLLLDNARLGTTIPGIGAFTPAYAKRPEFPVALSTGAIPSLPAELVLNEASLVDGEGLPVYELPGLTWRDENGNQRPDLGEPRGAWAIARLQRFGAGEILVLGDPTVFAREMAAENRPAAEALVAWLTRDDRLLVIDESHRASADPSGSAQLLAGSWPTSLAVALAAGAAASVLLVTFRPRLRRTRQRRPPETRPYPLTPAERAALAELEAAP